MSSNQKNVIQIHADDGVAVALAPLSKGTTVTVTGGNAPLEVTLLNDIPQGHKFALKDIAEGEPVIKYGYPIGAAKAAIKKGEHVHVHNTKTMLSETATYTYNQEKALASAKEWEKGKPTSIPEIKAYKRSNGKIGIRNELWIVPTVGCVNKISETLANWANGTYFAGEPKPNPEGGFEGVFAWTHPYGCSQMGNDHEKTRIILADLVKHPNAGAVLVLGLGCENNTIAQFKALLGDYDENRVKFLIAQESQDEIADGKALIKELAEILQKDKRETVSANQLVMGMKCGGSDGLSGITGNALVGRVCDAMVGMDATVMLTEVPEMFGAEQILMDRCLDKDMFDRTVNLINGFKDYYVRHNQVVYENPSPGNKAGGITTLEDKSLGCVQKGGKAPVSGVLQYGERVEAHGLNLLEGPGNDIVSTTAMTAAGAHVILFTTGRGTPLGAPAPTVKIATNHPLAENKAGWIDFDASKLLADDPNSVRDELLQFILDVASGRKQTKNEINGYREIAIFKEGGKL